MWGVGFSIGTIGFRLSVLPFRILSTYIYIYIYIYIERERETVVYSIIYHVQHISYR